MHFFLLDFSYFFCHKHELPLYQKIVQKKNNKDYLRKARKDTTVKYLEMIFTSKLLFEENQCIILSAKKIRLDDKGIMYVCVHIK
jgi:hypothetical protein